MLLQRIAGPAGLPLAQLRHPASPTRHPSPRRTEHLPSMVRFRSPQVPRVAFRSVLINGKLPASPVQPAVPARTSSEAKIPVMAKRPRSKASKQEVPLVTGFSIGGVNDDGSAVAFAMETTDGREHRFVCAADGIETLIGALHDLREEALTKQPPADPTIPRPVTKPRRVLGHQIGVDTQGAGAYLTLRIEGNRDFVFLFELSALEQIRDGLTKALDHLRQMKPPAPDRRAATGGRGVTVGSSGTNRPAGFPTTPLQFVRMQKRVLEDLLGPDWFVSFNKHHPAYRRWLLCNELLQSGNQIDTNDRVRLLHYLELVLDNCSLVGATRGHLSRFVIGNLANYGDESVQTRIKSEIRESKKFHDVMVEFNYAAWHLSRGNQVRAFQAEGYPDFEVIVPCPLVHLAADCKRVKEGTNEQRFGQLVKDANKQIKTLNTDRQRTRPDQRSAPCHGLLVVDVADRVLRFSELGDPDPPEIDRVSDLLQDSMRTKNTTVSAALVTWRKLIVTPMTDGSGRDLCVFQQYSRIVRHQNPVCVLPHDSSFLELGNAIGHIPMKKNI
jgi:hypothetical protein